MTKVGVILPSRGLIFSETAEEVLNNLKGIPHRIYFAHKLPIPDCFELPLQKALKDKEITHIWTVEDDTILPPNILQNMLWKHKPVVTCDYPVTPKKQGAVFKDAGGNVIFTGTGCMLVERDVFDKLKKPYFRSDIRWNVQNFGKYIKMSASLSKGIESYGLHDVNFGVKLWKAGIKITVMDTLLGQRKLVKLGESGTNNGAHQIEEWTEVEPDSFLHSIQNFPVMPVGDLVSVMTPSGEIRTDKKHAKKLLDLKLGKKPPKRHILVDENGYDI